ncbi:MAG: ATP synthase F1 subunit delta [Proteobacteria bacterium]|nr:ATP synthase F1 subunit delta [Pseudomonadota bacterium]
MKKNRKIARRYAKALLLIGREDGRVEAYREELTGFAGLLEKQTDLGAAIESPIYPTAARKKVLEQVLVRLSYADVMSAFFLLMFDKGRIGLVDAVNEVFQELADEEKGIARASVATAGDLSDEIVEQIREGLSKLTGKEVLVTVAKDPALIGGVVTRIGDLVLDGSVRTQLANLKESLKRSEAV